MHHARQDLGKLQAAPGAGPVEESVIGAVGLLALDEPGLDMARTLVDVELEGQAAAVDLCGPRQIDTSAGYSERAG